MAGIKRRVESTDDGDRKRSKQQNGKAVSPSKQASLQKGPRPSKSILKKQVEEVEEDSSDQVSSDADSLEEGSQLHTSDEDEGSLPPENKKASKGAVTPAGKSSSREAHAKQKKLARERKAAKANADAIARTKKLWERLRRKSHVPQEERKELIAELFGIITGRVRDFVFKHDSVRVIQTALKYASPEQRKAIALELKGECRTLAESKYAKFLLGKMLVHGDSEIRDMIIPEFYGHVKKLMRHPEASWILDDIYRTVATPAQKATILREWYGTEFAIFRSSEQDDNSAELCQILEKNPEKRAPIMKYLHELINLLVQKRTTGFTMLHDAMLQYFLNTKPGSTEATEFLELLKSDEEGNLVKNLGFTKSGARLMCLSLAYANAKDRKLLLRMYRDTVKLLAGDVHGHTILLTAFEVIDDTKLTSKLIFPELLSQSSTQEEREADLIEGANNLTARIPLLYLFAGDKVKWLLTDTDQQILDEVRRIRTETSKKDPHLRRQELAKAASPTLLEFIASKAGSLVETSFGCRFVTEVLLGAEGDKAAALTALAETAQSQAGTTMETPAAGRMLKTLVQGGRFNNDTKAIEKVNPPLTFGDILYERIKDDIMAWATKSNPFVIVALAEAEDFEKKDELLKTLKKNKKTLEEIAKEGEKKKDRREKQGPAPSAAKLLLEKI
ncbi:hypothetical protein VTO42DRAFT_1143 [Malbranchea cinnamomea]